MRSIVSRKIKSKKAFTLIELLVVLAILAILASLMLPGMTRLQGESRQTQCGNNLRQLALAHLVYGTDNRESLPIMNTGGNWLWDVAPAITDALGRYGAARQTFYCPSYPEQNVDGLWNFGGSFRVLGYALTLQGLPSILTSNANSSISTKQTVLGLVFFPPQPAATRVLVADANLSDWGQVSTAQKLTYRYSGIVGGWPVPHHSANMDVFGQYPSGANVVMLDGHTEWRPFSTSVCRTQGGSPGFWW